jgi:uncharacterized tellurite resistance protein B-like protein
MDNQKREILKSLAEIAWADGKVTDEERALLFSTCLQLGATPEELEDLEAALGQPNEAEEDASLKAVLPDKSSRLNVMRALLTMSFVDGAVGFAEFDVIEKKSRELEVTPEELETLREEASQAAEAFNRV